MIASGALMERKVGRVRVIGTCYADPTVLILACPCIEDVSSLRRLLGEPVDRGFSLYGVVIK